MLSLDTSEKNGVFIVTFEDIADAGDNRQTLQRQGLYQLIDSQNEPRFAFDLGAIRYLTSSDIGFLITVKRRITARKGRAILFAVDPYVVDILRTMKLYPLFEYAADLRETMARLAAPAAS